MKFLRISARIRKWKADRKLKKTGYESWAQYNRMTDPDIFWGASRVNNFYKGYPWVYHFARPHQIYSWDIAYDGSYDIVEWCSKNTTGKYRFDCLRVIESTNKEWEFNELGGGDYYFVAFKDEIDYTMFFLRWS